MEKLLNTLISDIANNTPFTYVNINKVKGLMWLSKNKNLILNKGLENTIYER